MYNHNVHILGCTPNNFQSQKLVPSAIEYVKPELLILGGISDNYLRLFQRIFNIKKRYQHPIWKPEKMQCKERMGRYLQTRLQQDSDLLWDYRKKIFTWINHQDKRILPQEYLTAAQLASTREETRIVFGKPSDTLVFQDLIMRYSTQELQGIADRAIQKTK